MSLSQDELVARYHDFSELYEHLANFHEKTSRLCNEILEYGSENIKLVDLRLSEIFSLYNTANVYLSVKADLYHYETSSLLSFWNEMYFQTYMVVRDNDQNTSWMHERFQNYSHQYENVEEMLKSRLEELKELIN